MDYLAIFSNKETRIFINAQEEYRAPIVYKDILRISNIGNNMALYSQTDLIAVLPADTIILKLPLQ